MPDTARRRGWANRWSRAAPLALACALGAVAALGQAPWSLWPLSIAAFAGLYGLYIRAATWRRAAWLGLAGGAGYFALALSWIVEPFLIDIARHGWMAPFALLLSAVGFALFWALAQGVARALMPGGVGWMRGAALVWIASLTLCEALRGWLLTGFPWAQPGHALIDTAMLGWSAVGGALPLTALVLGAAVALWHVARGRRLMGAAALAGFAALYAVAPMLDRAPAPAADAPIIRIVQPNVPQEQKWDPAYMGFHYDRQMDLTAAPGTPDLIVWPETALPVLLNRAEETLRDIAAAARGVPMVLGVQRADGARYYNSMILTDGAGRQTALYDKHHLVPFGEYMPLGDLAARFGLRGLAQQYGNGYSAGPGPQMMDLGALGRAVPLICYEGVFARDVAGAPGRADMLLLLTNDAWFGEVSGPYQHLAQARLRSAEQGLPMIRAANTGVSAMIDAAGQITAQISLGEAGYIDAALPPPAPPTPYARTGDWPALLLLALMAIVPAALQRRKNRTLPTA
ncbi:apolipoprotein N-acyltransferase [Roseovarius nanhaiticus]|uniref:apolipoprotein N-acyltransferase n=1 Tax=Roseovarius nanhaiticus TaxID=573024 RepID=UPI000970CE49|nr:apolipoprotein N-acyltransferase [Roseovarius nanhaiticus]